MRALDQACLQLVGRDLVGFAASAYIETGVHLALQPVTMSYLNLLLLTVRNNQLITRLRTLNRLWSYWYSMVVYCQQERAWFVDNVSGYVNQQQEHSFGMSKAWRCVASNTVIVVST